MNFVVYIIWSKKLDRFYIGTTIDPVQRLLEHNNHKFPNSFTSRGIPWEMFFVIENLSSLEAYALEKRIKAMRSKKFIRNLKIYPELVDKQVQIIRSSLVRPR